MSWMHILSARSFRERDGGGFGFVLSSSDARQENPVRSQMIEGSYCERNWLFEVGCKV